MAIARIRNDVMLLFNNARNRDEAKRNAALPTFDPKDVPAATQVILEYIVPKHFEDHPRPVLDALKGDKPYDLIRFIAAIQEKRDREYVKQTCTTKSVAKIEIQKVEDSKWKRSVCTVKTIRTHQTDPLVRTDELDEFSVDVATTCGLPSLRATYPARPDIATVSLRAFISDLIVKLNTLAAHRHYLNVNYNPTKHEAKCVLKRVDVSTNCLIHNVFAPTDLL